MGSSLGSMGYGASEEVEMVAEILKIKKSTLKKLLLLFSKMVCKIF